MTVTSKGWHKEAQRFIDLEMADKGAPYRRFASGALEPMDSCSVCRRAADLGGDRRDRRQA
jgi:hypothetical protein